MGREVSRLTPYDLGCAVWLPSGFSHCISQLIAVKPHFDWSVTD